MKWLKLSNRYLNLAHVASVYAHAPGPSGKPECDVLVAGGEYAFSVAGADATALLIAIEEECK